jgi:tRNA A37 threonylcarbamoyladenosine synthetase subunit TsaC/SUA5/YrdC
VVCDLSNKAAALKLFNVMELAPKKQLSILVGGFNDISTYTTGAASWYNVKCFRQRWMPCMCYLYMVCPHS